MCACVCSLNCPTLFHLMHGHHMDYVRTFARLKGILCFIQGIINPADLPLPESKETHPHCVSCFSITTLCEYSLCSLLSSPAIPAAHDRDRCNASIPSRCHVITGGTAQRYFQKITNKSRTKERPLKL